LNIDDYVPKTFILDPESDFYSTHI
jgi:hypothetical protein